MVEWNLIYIPILEEGKSHFKRFKPGESGEWALEKIRPVEPLKQFFMKFKEVVGRPGGSFEKSTPSQAIIGAKSCDLRALEVYDKVFLEGEFVDPFYKERREKTVLISADCPQPEASCFCNLVGVQPHPTSGFDLNLSTVENGYIVEVGSEKGTSMVKSIRTLFQPASAEQLEERKNKRANALKTLESINGDGFKEDLSKSILEKKESEFWTKESTTCVECCACLHICPTCYCFLLYDQLKEDESERVRVWDACYYAAYARVGGGANPRPDFSRRFQNRFLCKYTYFPQYHGLYACSGCGRCILGCTAKIDIRDVICRA
jgi:hypothetical protein